MNLPIGSIISSTIPLTDACFHLLDGSIISGIGIYSDFYEYVVNKAEAEGAIIASADGELSLPSSKQTWFTMTSNYEKDLAATGNSGKFVINKKNQTVRLPRITKYIQGLSSIEDIGTSLEAGLPNIEGTVRAYSALGEESGAFTLTNKATTTNVTGGSSGVSRYTMVFNAQDSNPIYGKSTEVQTNATRFPYYIVLANTINTDVAVDINKLTNDLNILSNRIENINAILSARDYIVEQGENYIRLNSGKQICWGITTSLQTGKATIKLPISFINTEYIVFYSLHEESPTNTNSANLGQFSTTNRTTETFDTRDYVKQKVWLAIGKWK